MKDTLKRRRINGIIHILGLAGLIGLTAVSCADGSLEGWLIVTEVPADNPGGDFSNGIAWKENLPSQFVAVRPGAGNKRILLSGDFQAVRSPELSFDGERLLFTGREKREDAWQVWEMDLGSLKARKLSPFPEDCTDPAYLPGSRIVFTRHAGKNNPDGEALYRGNLDGSGMERISFHPHEDRATSVLQDGRLVFISRGTLPGTSRACYMVMRPDGTKALRYHMPPEGSEPEGRARETDGGKLLFIQSVEDFDGGILMSLDRNRPLHSAGELSMGIKGSFRYVFPLTDTKSIVSYRPTGTEQFALYEFEAGSGSPGTRIYGNPGFHAAEAIPVRARTRPRDLPSEVNTSKTTGLLFCQDIHFSAVPEGNPPAGPGEPHRAASILVNGIRGPLGEAGVEEDGSFYLQVIADKAFQISTLDGQGNTVRGPSGWMWIRPNERRGCAGCHEDPETTPQNRVPMAVKKPPVDIPANNPEKDETNP